MITQDQLQHVYDQVKTPYKYGLVLKPQGDKKYFDCPSVFRHKGRWYMVYVSWNEHGYETHLAGSDDLLTWEPLGTILPFSEHTWDCCNAGGGIALVDPTWGGSSELEQYNGWYWMSFLGGHKPGYEADPLSIGIAYSRTPDKPTPWTRFDRNPVLQPTDADAREFEKATLYKSYILHDRAKTLGHEFVMFYNGKQAGPRGWERIGMAVSDDMTTWKRHGPGPVIDNGTGISGDAQITRMGDLWVMHYFGHRWKPAAFDTFAVSKDLVNWTKWDGPHTVEPSEPWDKTFAHKPWVLKHQEVVYHFYCAVGDQGRAIALATSRDLR